VTWRIELSTANSHTSEEREESMSSDSSTVNELLLQMLLRLGRIEEQLAQGTPQVPPSRELSAIEDMLSEFMDHIRRMERNSDELSDRVRRLERNVDRTPNRPPESTIGDGTVDYQNPGIVHTMERDRKPVAPPVDYVSSGPERVRKSTSSIKREVDRPEESSKSED
jgi:hypothetical protein